MSDSTHDVTDQPESSRPVPDPEVAEDLVAEEILPTDDVLIEVDDDAEGLTPERLGGMAIKFATETAYAAAGVADLVARSTKDFIDAQRKQLAERTPEGVDPNFKKFVDQMPDQFKAFLDDVTRTYHDMAERGRGAVTEFQSQMQAPKPERVDPDGAFDAREDVDAVDADAVIATEEVEDVIVVDEVVEETPDPGSAESWPEESDESTRS